MGRKPSRAPPQRPALSKDKDSLLDDALTSLKKFGTLRADSEKRARKKIVEAAVRFNQYSLKYQGPRQGEIVAELETLRNCARQLASVLKTLTPVSLGWLTGAVATAAAPDLFPQFRYAPVPAPAEGSSSPSDDDLPWSGPQRLFDDDAFVAAFREAFAHQIEAVANDLDQKRERNNVARSAADGRMQSATSPDEYEEGLREWLGVCPEFDRRADLSEPLAIQTQKLGEVADKVLKEFLRSWPKDKGGKTSSPLAHEAQKTDLAIASWKIVVKFYGPKGFDQIAQTPTGIFGYFVKEVARYALGRELSKAEFEPGIRHAARDGESWVNRKRSSGADPFKEYNFFIERFGRP
jgi:hypothetical protein